MANQRPNHQALPPQAYYFPEHMTTIPPPPLPIEYLVSRPPPPLYYVMPPQHQPQPLSAYGRPPRYMMPLQPHPPPLSQCVLPPQQPPPLPPETTRPVPAQPQQQVEVRSNKRFPDRWQSYNGVGQAMVDVRILAFKTPLKEWFFEGMEDTDELRFTVSSLVQKASAAGKTLGLVVDLTNTYRYYGPEEWTQHGIEHVKLRCPGHDVNKDEENVMKFIEILRQFFERNRDNEKIVGVHCTHGLNRTGYLICRYMIDHLGWKAAEAVEAFQSARGYPIEREGYIASLHEAEQKKIAGERISGGVIEAMHPTSMPAPMPEGEGAPEK